MPVQLLQNPDLEFALRLLLSAVCGGVIGVERTRRNKGAGVKTHMLVAVGAALFVILSKYGFLDVITAEGADVDVSRVAAGVTTGVGFLGGGIIFLRGTSVQGLTTAAGIWMTASIGLAIGAGMYIVSAFMAILLFLMQYVFRRVPLGSESYDGYHLKFVVKTGENFQATLKEKLNEWNVTVVDSTITWKRNDVVDFDYVILCPEEIRYSEIRNFVKENDGVVSFSYAPQRRHFT